VALGEGNDHVGALSPVSARLTVHRLGLADACAGTQIDTKTTGSPDHVGGICPKRRYLVEAAIGPIRGGSPGLLGDLDGLPRLASFDRIASGPGLPHGFC
jgi:hypothetical protein